ncbi:unnamed protein product [Caenorhabditis sp. 36 PRJEB53466]|nr:unnamed protein product [Caenorhabditis sp. 36 PRJEB53466]
MKSAENMVQANGAITGTILKARFGNDIRKSSLHHNNDLTFIDLLLNVQRIFGLHGDSNVVLKYKDLEGDLVTLASDSDLLLALHTAEGALDVTVTVDSEAHEQVLDVQRQVDQLKAATQKLLSQLSTLDNLSSLLARTSISAPAHDHVVLQKTYEAPPSPVPSEKPELPATIQPSLQEQVDNFNLRPAHVEEDIPLEASYPPQNAPFQPLQADSLNSSFSQPPPIENLGAIPPPNATIPSFPTSNAALPPVQPEFNQYAPPPPTQQFQAPPPPVSASYSSVSSTPVPQGGPPQPNYGVPPAPGPFNAPSPPTGPPSEYGGYAPPPPNAGSGPQGFAPPPPPHQPQFGGPQQLPQSFQPPPPQFGGAPPAGGPQGFAPPPQQQGFAPPPPPSQGAPGGFAPPPPPGGPSGFSAPPPPQGFAAPQGPGAPGAPGGYGGPQQGGFAPPNASFGPPPTGFPAGGAPPQGGNPFARGPSAGYRQSPYHHCEKSEIINFEELECARMFDGDANSLARGSLFKFDDVIILEQILSSRDKCSEFQSIFQFFREPRSAEERAFPLAYGLLIHDNFVQISLLLSAIYQPQNQFCLAIDGNSSPEFIELIRMLSQCYDNIYYFVTEEIRWCGYEILTSVFRCVEHLTELKSDWKYYQYLSGVDAPLKSNLEMVRIFKALNGSFNAEIDQFEYYRLNRKRPWKSPLPLFKTSLSATFSRESANFMVKNEKVQEQIEYLRGTECADESLWATIAGNPKTLAMPGGFNAHTWLQKNRFVPRHLRFRHEERNGTYNVTSYYVSSKFWARWDHCEWIKSLGQEPANCPVH